MSSFESDQVRMRKPLLRQSTRDGSLAAATSSYQTLRHTLKIISGFLLLFRPLDSHRDSLVGRGPRRSAATPGLPVSDQRILGEEPRQRGP